MLSTRVRVRLHEATRPQGVMLPAPPPSRCQLLPAAGCQLPEVKGPGHEALLGSHLVFVKGAVEWLDAALLTHPQAVHRRLNQVLVVGHLPVTLCNAGLWYGTFERTATQTSKQWGGAHAGTEQSVVLQPTMSTPPLKSASPSISAHPS